MKTKITPMRFLIPSTHIPAFASLARSTSRAARKGTLLLFSIAVLLAGGAAAVRGQSALDGFDPNPSLFVTTVVVQPDGKILIAGAFTDVLGVERRHIARLNADGTLDTAFNPNANGVVYAIAVQADGKILIGGDFTRLGPQFATVRVHIARLDGTTGLVDPSDPFNTAANLPVRAIAVQADGKILVGGSFFSLQGSNSIGGQPRNGIARLYATGPMTGLADDFNPNALGEVAAIVVQADGKILVGGSFRSSNGEPSIGGQPRNKIARLDATGLADDFNPNAQAQSTTFVGSIAVQADGKILAGGAFERIGGADRNNIARLETDGTADLMFDPDASAVVRSIAVQADGKILAGGDFTNIGGLPRNHIARLDATTGRITSETNTIFDPNASNIVAAIAVQADGKILAGGYFSGANSIGGQTRNYIARLEIDGKVDRTVVNLNTDVQGDYVFATAIQADGKILIGGNFTRVLGEGRSNIARLNTDGTLDSFDPSANGVVYAIAVQADGRILVGGSFSSIGGQSRDYLARLYDTGPSAGLADGFNPKPNDLVRAIAGQADGKIVIGGDFIKLALNGLVSRKRIARLETNGVADGFTPDANDLVYSIAVQADGRILAGGFFNLTNSIGGQWRNYVARLYDTGSSAGLADDLNAFVSNDVYAIAVQTDGRILVGGNFDFIGGPVRNHIGRFYATGPMAGWADDFNPNANNVVYSIVAQADGKVLAGGFFRRPPLAGNSIGGKPRNHIARLEGTFGMGDSFDPNADNVVTSLAVQADGKILVGGGFNTMGEQPRNFFARLSNDTAALQNLAVHQNSFSWNTTWTRGGSSPQFTRVTFDYSPDNLTYTRLGNGRAIGRNWILTGGGGGFRFPVGLNFYIRARGYYRSGYANGSESITESVRNGFITPIPVKAATAINLSTRFWTLTCCAERDSEAGPAVPTGANVGIGGFIITGSAPKHVLIRAIGPSLSGLGVPGALADPVLELHGPDTFATITNDNWRDTQEAEILATGLPPTNDRESAIEATLEPGAYTAVVSGQNGTGGGALVEIYDVDEEPISKLANISTRAFVGTGDNVVIAGLILGNGDGDDWIVVRGIGPSLAAFGIPNALANPTLELRDSNGALLVSNNDWQENPEQAKELTALGLAPTNSLESGIVGRMPPGLYTALLVGLNNGTGVGLVEVYDLGTQ